MAKETVALDHLSIPVRKYKQARKLYDAALGAIGMTVNMDADQACGFGANGEKILWLVRDKKAEGSVHVALRVGSRKLVDAFHTAALAAGADDNGAPGPRPDYGPTYYAAFVRDLEGNNVEVVCYARGPKPKTDAGDGPTPRNEKRARKTKGG